MQKEIERKFLVNPKLLNIESQNIIDIHYHNHAYLQSSQSYQVRIELHKSNSITEEIGRINIKGPKLGISRLEFEYQIPINEARLIHSFCPYKISKIRYKIPYVKENNNLSNLLWEIDFYQDDNLGLVTAELEIPDDSMNIIIPNWIVKEITHDDRFYNKNLAIRPFKSWSLSEIKDCFSEL